VKIGRMRPTRVKRDDDTLMLQIDFYIFHAGNFLQHRSQLAHTVIAIFAFGGDLDRFHDGVIGLGSGSFGRAGSIFGFFKLNVRHPRNGRLVAFVISGKAKHL
jgi:hypothetical protein